MSMSEQGVRQVFGAVDAGAGIGSRGDGAMEGADIPYTASGLMPSVESAVDTIIARGGGMYLPSVEEMQKGRDDPAVMMRLAGHVALILNRGNPWVGRDLSEEVLSLVVGLWD
jgi:hypothetical protein